MSDAVMIAAISGFFAFVGLIPAFLISKRTARRDEFTAAQNANETAFKSLKDLYNSAVRANEELSKRLDAVVRENERLQKENMRLQQRNDKLEDENRELIKDIAEVRAENKSFATRLAKLEQA